MSKLIDQLENAIKSADWVTVCAVFKKMTGRTVEPPKVGPPPFDWKTAKKGELYKVLQEKLGELDPIKDYTTEDLRVMAQMSLNEEETEEDNTQEDLVDTRSPVTEEEEQYTYIPPGKTNLLNVDKKKLNPRFTEFPTYGDEGKSKVPRDRDAPTLMSAPCLKCRQTYNNIHPSLINKKVTGEQIYICPNCSESFR